MPVTKISTTPSQELQRAFFPLPDDVIRCILQKLDLKAILNCSESCQHLYRLCSEQSIWTRLFFIQFPQGRLPPSQHPKNTLREIAICHQKAFSGLYSEKCILSTMGYVKVYGINGDRTKFIAAPTDQNLKVYDLQSHKEVTFSFAEKSYVLQSINEIDSNTLLVQLTLPGHSKKKAKILDIQNNQTLLTEETERLFVLSTNTLAFSGSSKNPNHLKIWKRNGHPNSLLIHLNHQAEDVYECGNGTIVTISENRTLDAWDGISGKKINNSLQINIQCNAYVKLSSGSMLFYKVGTKEGEIYDPLSHTLTSTTERAAVEVATETFCTDYSGTLTVTGWDNRLLFARNSTSVYFPSSWLGRSFNREIAFSSPTELFVNKGLSLCLLDFSASNIPFLNQVKEEFHKISLIRELLDLLPSKALNICSIEDKEKTAFITRILIGHFNVENWTKRDCIDEDIVETVSIQLIKKDQTIVGLKVLLHYHDLSINQIFQINSGVEYRGEIEKIFQKIADMGVINFSLLRRVPLLPKAEFAAICHALNYPSNLPYEAVCSDAIGKYLENQDNPLKRSSFSQQVDEKIKKPKQ